MEDKEARKIVKEYIAFAVDGMWLMWIAGMLFSVTVCQMPRTFPGVAWWVWPLLMVLNIFCCNFFVNFKQVLAVRRMSEGWSSK